MLCLYIKLLTSAITNESPGLWLIDVSKFLWLQSAKFPWCTHRELHLFQNPMQVNLACAYRQLRTDPLSVPLFGIQLEQYKYLDMSLPFGCRASLFACVRTTHAVVHLLGRP